MTVWDELGITLDDYAKRFNKKQEAIFEEYLKPMRLQ